MKLKTIEKFVRRAGFAEIYEGADCVWISVGPVIAPLYGFRRIDDDQLRTVLNLNDRDRSKLSIERLTADVLEDGLLDDATEDEEQLEPPTIRLEWREVRHAVFISGAGALYVPTELLDPFLAEDKQARFFARPIGRRTVIAVKRGFFLAGIIEPMQWAATRELADALKTLYAQTERLLDDEKTDARIERI